MDFRVQASLLALLWCLCGVVFAGTNSWTAVGPNGGQVQKVIYNKTNPSIVYMISSGGFQRSLDGGSTWQTIRNDFFNPPQDLAVDPADSSHVYVVAPNAPFLLMSTDSGATLSAVASFPTTLINTWQVQVSQDGATVCVSGGLSVVCSTDQGHTWGAVTSLATYPSGQIYALAMDPSNAQTLYASGRISATTYGLYVTHDGAKTWQQLVSTTDPNSLALALAIDPNTPTRLWGARNSGLWVSNNSGAMWVSVVVSPSATPVSALAVSPANPANLYVGTAYGSIFATSDGGTTWTDVTSNIAAGEIFALAVHPTQASAVLAGGQVGVWGTTTAGASWQAQVAGLDGANVEALSADPTSDRIYLNLNIGGIYCIANGAATATTVNNGGLAQLAGTSNAAFVSGVLAQAGSPGLLLASLTTGVAHSTDGGNNWSLSPPPSTFGPQISVFASWPATPQTILGSTDSAYYRSTDGGTTWAAQSGGLPSGAIFGRLAAAGSDATIAYGSPYVSVIGSTTTFGVYRSTDSGQTWSPANAGIATSTVAAIVVDPSNAAVVYAIADTAVVKSTDGGTSWVTLPNATVVGTDLYTLAIDPVHPQILYAAGFGNIIGTVDGGATWETIRDPQTLPQWIPNSLLVDPNRPSDLLVATAKAGAQRITIAPDLSVSASAPAGAIGLAQPATYSYIVTNNGPFSASGVQVTLQVPAAAQGATATASVGTCSVVGATATCSLGVLKNGATANVALTATASAVGAFQVVGSVRADQADSDTTNNSVAINATVVNVADVAVATTGVTSVQVGGAVTYTVTVTNAGPNPATATQLNYQLAASLTPGTVTTSTGTCTTSASGLIACNLGDLPISQSVSITIAATAATAGTATSTATLTTTSLDKSASNNSATDNTTVTAPVTAPPPPGSSGGGGGGGGSGGGHGGGGALSIQWLIVLAMLLAIQKGRGWEFSDGKEISHTVS